MQVEDPVEFVRSNPDAGAMTPIPGSAQPDSGFLLLIGFFLLASSVALYLLLKWLATKPIAYRQSGRVVPGYGPVGRTIACILLALAGAIFAVWGVMI